MIETPPVTSKNSSSSSAPALPEQRPERPCVGVTARVAILCLSLAAFFGCIIPIIDYKLTNTFLGATHLPPGAIAALLVLLLVVNPLLRLLSKRLTFSRNEVLTVYISCLFSCLVPGHGAENFIIPNLVSPFYFATKENGYLTYLQPYLKPWLTPALTSDGQVNRALVDSFYLGSTSGDVPWGAWLVPLVFWGGFALASYAMLGFLCVMLRAQWAKNEALAFPLLKLPLELTQGMDENRSALPPFFKNPTMWCGFGIATFIQIVNGLHLYFPDVPEVPLTLNMGALFTEAPWNQMGWVNLSVYPIGIGIAYLLTTEVSLSLWAFFWFIKIQFIVAYSLGYMSGTMPDASGAFYDKVFTGYQGGGAFLSYVAIILWMARKHLKHVMRRGFGLDKASETEKTEVVSYPVAFWGFVLSFGVMVGATCVAGVRVDIAIALWTMYLVYAIGLTRVAVEGGMLFLLHQAVPLGIVERLIGTQAWLTPANGLAPVAFFQAGFANHMRAFLMPSFMQSFKLAHDREIHGRRLGWLLTGVIVTSLCISWPNIVRLAHQNGALQMGHQWYFSTGSKMPVEFISAMTNPDTVPLVQKWGWLSFGGLLTYGMMLARSRFMWFPLHPLGYLMCLSFPMQMFWFSIFLGWMAKTIISRFGGAETVRKATPLFLGLVFGDVTMMLFWLLIDGWTGRTVHQLMPG